MQYNQNSDSQDIVSLIGDTTGIDTTVELKQITRAANEANKKIWSWIFASYGGWTYDDSNYTNLPIATTDLTADQSKYILPSEALTVRAVEYKNDGGNWSKLEALSVSEINQYRSEQEWMKTPSVPRYYSIVSDVVKLYPAPDTSRSDALRVQFDRGSVSFASTDIEQDPGFASEFHGSVATGASYFIGINKTLSNWELIRSEWLDAEQRIKDYYTQRWDEKFPPEFITSDTLRQYI